jgi:DNA-binding response OmpR family regulator
MGKEKILIIDDEPDIVETLTLMLQARNYDVVTAMDGTEGLAKVKTERPDITLLDIMMPGMSGYDVCQKLKTSNDTKKMPVIMLTAKGENEAVMKARKAGADDYIVKPFNLPTLVNKVNKLLARH